MSKHTEEVQRLTDELEIATLKARIVAMDALGGVIEYKSNPDNKERWWEVETSTDALAKLLEASKEQGE